jgi:hypothetical protein
MIIFGFRSFVKQLAMLMLVCGSCHNPAAHRVLLVTRMFTLFFIPLFPVSRRRQMTCTFCGAGTRLTKAQAEQLMTGAGDQARALPAQPAGQQPPTPPAGSTV